MSEVRLTIGRREYAVACAEGEEPHVRSLGAMIDAKLDQLGGNLSANETQNLLFGALFVADELHETKKRLDALEREATEARAAADRAVQQADEAHARLAELAASLAASEQQLEFSRKTIVAADEAREAGKRDAAAATARIAELEQQLVAAHEGHRVLTEELAQAQALAQAAPQGAAMDEAELVPALERFAELLEDCANKLESSAAAS